MKRALLNFAIFTILGASVIGRACAFAATTYLADQNVTVQGTLTEFLYRNPHSFMKVDVTNDNGQKQTWTVEWAGVAQLSQSNITRDTLRPGDVVSISGNPGSISGDYRMRLTKIVRSSDGWTWQGVVN